MCNSYSIKVDMIKCAPIDQRQPYLKRGAVIYFTIEKYLSTDLPVLVVGRYSLVDHSEHLP
jgi:hypothetical protein